MGIIEALTKNEELFISKIQSFIENDDNNKITDSYVSIDESGFEFKFNFRNVEKPISVEITISPKHRLHNKNLFFADGSSLVSYLKEKLSRDVNLVKIYLKGFKRHGTSLSNVTIEGDEYFSDFELIITEITSLEVENLKYLKINNGTLNSAIIKKVSEVKLEKVSATTGITIQEGLVSDINVSSFNGKINIHNLKLNKIKFRNSPNIKSISFLKTDFGQIEFCKSNIGYFRLDGS